MPIRPVAQAVKYSLWTSPKSEWHGIPEIGVIQVTPELSKRYEVLREKTKDEVHVRFKAGLSEDVLSTTLR